MNAAIFRVGAAASVITPALGASLNGGMWDNTASYVHDDLHARAVWLEDAGGPLAIVVCDSCMIPRAILDEAKHLIHSHTGLPLDRQLIAATHTHSAPTCAPSFQSDPQPGYAPFLVQRIADAVRCARASAVPAAAAWGVALEPTSVHNRRWRMKPGVQLVDPFGQPEQVKMNPQPGSLDLDEPAGPTDPQIVFLAFRSLADERPLAVFANYSLHYVGGVGAGHISADYFAAFADRLQSLLGADRLDPPFLGMMSNGTSGNINNINFRVPAAPQSPYEQIRRVADATATEVFRTMQSCEFHSDVTLAMREAPLRLARRATPPEDIKRATQILAKAQPVLQSMEEVYARETVLLSAWPEHIDTTVQALRIGPVGLAASPCETFVETGLAIKAESPLRPTMVVSLANDYGGYLPTAEQHRLGGYETWRARSSFLEVAAEEKVRVKLLALLEQIAS